MPDPNPAPETVSDRPPAAPAGGGPAAEVCPVFAARGYALEGVLGRGGMGVVYKAWDTRLNRPVALKMMLGGDYADPLARVRFQVEAEAVAQLQHPNIVQLYEFGVHDGLPFVALEFVGGGSLGDRLKAGGAFPPRAAAGMAAKLADAVAAAHAKGIIHRDLKPHNVLLTPGGEPRVADFGLARIGESEMTVTGASMGTPAYMAPEQAAGRTREVGTAADVYALGVILYELATGRRPFEGSPDVVARRQITDPPPAPRSVCRAVPWDLQTICLKCLEKDPRRRYSAVGLGADLRAFLAGRPIAARPVGAAERFVKWTRRSPWRAAALGAAALAALAAAGAGVAVARDRAAVRREAQAGRVVDALVVSDTVDVPRLARELDGFGDVAVPALREVAAGPVETRAGLHARLALLGDDPGAAAEVAAYGPGCRADELLPIREMLGPYRAAVAPGLWAVLADGAADPARRLRAGCLLAGLAPADPRWAAAAPALATMVVREDPLDAVVWATALDPVKAHLIPVLLARYPALRDRLRSRAWEDDAPVGDATALDLTAGLLARYAADQPAALGELAVTVQARHYQLYDAAIAARAEAVAPVLRAALRAAATQDWAGVTAATPFGPADAAAAGPAAALAVAVPDAAADAAARRRARAAAALLKLGEDAPAWPILRGGPDPTARAYLIHRLAGIGVDPGVLIRRFAAEAEPPARKSLLLALGEYAPDQIPAADRAALTADLLRLYRDHPHPGLHSAIDWLVRQRWAGGSALDRIDAALAGAAPGPRDWFVAADGQTFAVVRGPVEFVMGSPATEAGRVPADEAPHRLAVRRAFAVGTKEVTTAQFLRFRPGHRWTRAYNPDPAGPAVAVDWPDAAAYCNWLSEREGVPPDQWCYEPDPRGRYDVGMRARPGHLRLTGYRLPTEAEWEYACRAGSAVSRSYGRSVELLRHYAWYFRNADNRAWPVGRLRPNDLGAFDMLGNVLEWVDDPVPEADRVRPADDEYAGHPDYRGPGDRHPRGGSFNYQPEFVRSAACVRERAEYRLGAVGFRVARTLPPR